MDSHSLIECIDIGGTHTRCALISNEIIRAEKSILTPKEGMPVVLQVIESLSHELRAHVKEKVIHTCIGFPGPIQNDILLNSAPLGVTREVDLAPWKNHFDNPVQFENDLNLAIHAELAQGVGKNTRNFFLLTLSTGIGAGIVWNGKIMEGSVGEFGHTTLDSSPAALECACGRKGCWCTHSSGKGMEEKAPQMAGKKYTAVEIFAAKKEAWAAQLIRDAKRFNAIGIGNMLNALPVDAIVIMGSLGVNQFNEIIPTKEEISQHTVNPVPTITKTQLSDAIGVWGAYYVGKNKGKE